MAEKKVQVGIVTHYFDKIGVAVVKAQKELKAGDKIQIEALEPFTQVIKSMQVEHAPIKAAKAGQEVGMKVEKPVKEGNKIFKA